MIDINIIRNDKDRVINNLKKKYQEHKINTLDEIIELDKKVRELKQTGDDLRKEKNTLSGEIGLLMRDKKIDEANKNKERVVEINKELESIEENENKLGEELKQKMTGR